jgi:multisubunit Na+/H+ antiporter MnhB subunit
VFQLGNRQISLKEVVGPYLCNLDLLAAVGIDAPLLVGISLLFLGRSDPPGGFPEGTVPEG